MFCKSFPYKCELAVNQKYYKTITDFFLYMGQSECDAERNLGVTWVPHGV